MKNPVLRRRAFARRLRRRRAEASAARAAGPPRGPAGLSRALAAEALGTGLLVAAVVGSGIHAQSLSRDVGLALLENTIASAAALFALIVLLAPISGAHFNPAVTIAAGVRGVKAIGFASAQVVGGVVGAILANGMFGLPAVSWSDFDRTSFPTLLSEVVATYGLVLIAIGMPRSTHARWTPVAIACWIAGAYWFTSSTSFANPAVTIARMFSNTFAGIAPKAVLPFIAAQAVGAALAWLSARWFFTAQAPSVSSATPPPIDGSPPPPQSSR